MRSTLITVATALALAVTVAAPAIAQTDLPAETDRARPAAWHDIDRVFAQAPTTSTSGDLKLSKRLRLSPPPGEPDLACYYTEHRVNRCPQAKQP